MHNHIFQQKVIDWNFGEQGRSHGRLMKALELLTGKKYDGTDGGIYTSWNKNTQDFIINIACKSDVCPSTQVMDLLGMHKARE